MNLTDSYRTAITVGRENNPGGKALNDEISGVEEL
jgi:hypothetical protein